MTTCLRSIKFNLHPKLAMIQGRRSTSNVGLSKVAHSSFLNEFLDNRNAWQAEKNAQLANSLADLSTYNRFGVATYDPALHAIAKPLAETSDDIMLCNSETTLFSTRLSEDDLLYDVIRRENYSVTVLSGTMPVDARGATVWSAKASSNAIPEKGAVLSAGQGEKGQPAQDPAARPTEQQLDAILTRLSDTLPNLFIKPLDYSIYHIKVVFENNIRGVTTYGISPYIQQMSLLRVVGHFKYAYVKLELLKVTKHTEDGTVRIRWRIRGIPALKVMLKFWKFRLWNYESVRDKEIDWFDGFSIFYVNGDGVIYRHVCDKMVPDDHKVKNPTPIAAKLALLIGVLPRPALESICSFSEAEVKPHIVK